MKLINSTNNQVMDDYIEAIIGIYEAAFPNRIRGYYLVGSYGDDTAINGSDIDMEIIFKDEMTEDENQRCDVIKASCRALCPIHLDLPVKAEANFAQHDTVALKLASKFIYGEDTREQIPLPAKDVYLRRISGPTQRGLTIRFRSEQVTIPLDYPNKTDEFYGYIPKAYAKSDTPIKLWVLNIGWLATFSLVYQAKIFVPSKRHMLKLYREHINDEWTDFITEVYQSGRNQWHYQIPEHHNERKRFKTLCQKTLDFENYVATIYINYLKQEHKAGDESMSQKRLAAFSINRPKD